MKSISLRLWMQMLLLICITITLLWIFQIEFLDKFYTSSTIKNVKAEGEALSKLFVYGDDKEIENKLDELTIKYNASVEVYDLSGAMIYSSEGGYGMMGIDRRITVAEALKGKSVQEQIRHKRFNTNILLQGIPIMDGETSKGVVLITVPLAAVEETTYILKQQLSLIIIVLVIVSILLSFFFSRRFTRPILKINEAASRMAEGNLAIKVDVASKDELGMLANTINNLSEQLLKIEQLRKDLIANVSHEFRTPLSLIKGYAETIKDITGDNKQKREKQLDIIIDESDRLKLMIDDILSLSQMQSDYIKLKPSEFNIMETIKSVSNRFTYIKENKAIKININAVEDTIYVFGDEMKIEQVLYNIIGNAFNHSPHNSIIDVNIKKCENNILVEVIDYGNGIKKEDIPHIWNRFYKASSGSDESSQGTGLGLAIVKTIMEAHELHYGVESEVGKGTMFWFELKQHA